MKPVVRVTNRQKSQGTEFLQILPQHKSGGGESPIASRAEPWAAAFPGHEGPTQTPAPIQTQKMPGAVFGNKTHRATNRAQLFFHKEKK